MKNKLIVLMLIVSLVLTGCSNTKKEPIVKPIQSQSAVSEMTELDEQKIITYIQKWDSEMSAVSDNFSYFSDLMRVVLDDEIIETIIQEEFDGLEYGSDEYIKAITQWVEKNMAHTQLQEEYRNSRGKEPWLGTYKILLPYEMKKLGIKRDVYMGKCTSLSNFIISMLRSSGLSKDDYTILTIPKHTIAIFKYNDELYVVDNNRIVLLTDDIKEKPLLCIGYYHEDSSMISKFTLSEDFYKFNGDEGLSQRITKLNYISETEIYKSNLNNIHIKYIEHRIDVPDFNLYIKASIEEPNVQILSRSLIGLTDVLNWVKLNIEMVSNQDRVQLADETIVFSRGTALDRAILIKSLLFLKDIDSSIYYNYKETYVEVDGEYYSVVNFNNTQDIEIKKFKVY